MQNTEKRDSALWSTFLENLAIMLRFTNLGIKIQTVTSHYITTISILMLYEMKEHFSKEIVNIASPALLFSDGSRITGSPVYQSAINVGDMEWDRARSVMDMSDIATIAVKHSEIRIVWSTIRVVVIVGGQNIAVNAV